MKMLTFKQFVDKYLGKAPDWDKSGSAQCVDLAKAYLKDVHGVAPFSVVSAKNYFVKYKSYKGLMAKFERIYNTLDFVPLKGDIAVWDSTKGGGHGHVAICTGEGDTKHFYSYDMNWNGKAMKRVKHDYKGFYGVLRPYDRSMIDDSRVYNVVKAVNVREGAGSKYRRVMYSEFAEEHKKAVTVAGGKALDNDFPKGMKVTVKKVDGTWGLTDSGWISLNFCKEVK